MLNEQKRVIIAIISKDDNFEKLKTSINNLRENNFNDKEIITVIKGENNANLQDKLKKMHVKYYEYTKIEDIYYELPKTVYYDYISFINAGDIYNSNFKEKLLKNIEKVDLNSIFVCPIKYNNEKYGLNKNIAKLKKVNIEKNYDKIWIHLNSTFIGRELLEKIEKSSFYDLECFEDIDLLTKLILLSGSYKIINKIHLTSYESLEDSTESNLIYYNKKCYENLFNYINDIKTFCLKYVGISKYVQYSTMYILKKIIIENANSKNKHILNNEKLDSFYENVRTALENIDDEIIMKMLGNKLVNYYLLRVKYKKETSSFEYREFLNDEIYLANDNTMLMSASDTKIKVLLMEYQDNILSLTCTYTFPFDEGRLKIYAKYKDKKINVTKNNVYTTYKAFGRKIYDSYSFNIKIPLEESSRQEFIEFYLKSSSIELKLDLNFNKPLSKLSSYRHSYYNCGAYSLNYRNNSIMVMPNNKLRHFKREVKYIVNLFHQDEYAKSSAKLRILYHLTKPFFKKEIWLFEDKIYKAGDNGEYLYTYASCQKDGIKKYYILNESSFDVKRFKKLGKKYVKFGSLKHKLLFLNSNIVFQTHNNVTKQHSFDNTIEKYFRDLFNSYNVCIQHGLTVQFIPDSTNRINDNLKKFFLASEVERKNLSNKEYDYNNHNEILKITGCPRYDGLKNNDKKQILITPTWRNYLALPSLKYGESRRHNNGFKQSNYFKIYNNLINNEKLIKTAKKYGYKIIYLLHPCTSSQINDFDKNKNVELVAATDDLNYEKILTESSLMVTDYSGVQFDFAYMYKPIIYFHPTELPPSYDEGEYNYETMSLGEIVSSNEQLVDLLCSYIESDCKIKDKYKNRIDAFFKYHDFNNCQRIYKEIMEARNEYKKKKK